MNNYKIFNKIINSAERVILLAFLLTSGIITIYLWDAGFGILFLYTVIPISLGILIFSILRTKTKDIIIKSTFAFLEFSVNGLALCYIFLGIAPFLGYGYGEGFQFLFFPVFCIAILFISAIWGALIGFVVGSVQSKERVNWRVIAFLLLLAIGAVIFYIYIAKFGGGSPLFNFFISAINWSAIVSSIVLAAVLIWSVIKKNYGYALLSAFTVLLIATSVGANFGINKVSTSKSCLDSDGGKNFYILGEVNSASKDINNNSVYKDRCYDSANGSNDWSVGYVVREFYCGDYGKVAYEDYECSGYCYNGKCIDVADNSKGFGCVDSGFDVNKKGRVQIFFNDRFLGEVEDSCLNSNTVWEYSCHDNDSKSPYIDSRDIKCKYGCSNGVCLSR